ncbi:MAG: PEP-CTERM sorting domain-containing protein [Cyanobacteria bacterium J06635_10]
MVIKKLFSRLSIGALLAAAITVAANPARAADEYIDVQKLVTEEVTIDFDEKVFKKNNGDKVKVRLGNNSNPFLRTKNEIEKLWENDYGLEMSSTRKDGNESKLWLYQTNCKPGENCTNNNDPDLATGEGEYIDKGKTIKYNTDKQGRVLIIQENETGRPDDNVGGTIKFNFTDELGVDFNSIGLLDLDEHKLPEFQVKFFGEDNLTNWFKFDERNRNVSTTSEGNTETLTLGNSNYITEMTRQRGTKNGVKTDENSLREYNFDFGDKRITEFHVKLSGSGAVTGFNYARRELKFAKRVPEPTSILGLVAVSGLVASSLKRKRQSSNAEIIQ